MRGPLPDSQERPPLPGVGESKSNLPMPAAPVETSAPSPVVHEVPRREAAPSTKAIKVWKGSYYPLGATFTGDGVNFALFSENATGVELCLFDKLGENETARVRLTERA